jgi:hypothetical protein
MLTLLSNVKQNPAARESEAGAIYICLPPSKAKNGSETRHDNATFLTSAKRDLSAFQTAVNAQAWLYRELSRGDGREVVGTNQVNL